MPGRRTMAAPQQQQNMHATALVAGETGILVTGQSGSGKSALALDLIRSAASAGRFAALVADDQVLLQAVDGRVLAAAPSATAGLVEVRGSAIVSVPHLRRAVMHVVISLDPSADQPRLPDPQDRCDLGKGIRLPLLRFRPGGGGDPLVLLEAFEKGHLLR